MKQPLGVLVLATAWVAAAAAGEPPVSGRTALDDYIAKPDPTYAWRLVQTLQEPGYTAYIVDLKSQTWRTPAEVNRTVWQHWLVIVKPDQVKHDTGFVMIGGGRNGGAAPAKPSPEVVRIATETHSIAAELRMIPNQPLVFDQDGKERVEDDLIGYCWNKYLKTGDATWLPRLPMVKSVVRAMDTITALLASDASGKTPVNKFVVGGASKRGWTTWLTGAADKRVVAIVPIVIDVVNVRPSMMHHYSAYGFWAPAIKDYVHHKIPEQMNTPQFAALVRIVDPYVYRDRLTMPKFVVNASGDQFFVPDSSQLYFDDLKGVKYLRYVPNADHSLRGSDALASIVAFYQAILNGSRLPQFSWKLPADGSIEIHCDDPPTEVSLWQATNPKARDFRLESIGKAYRRTSLAPTGTGNFRAAVATPGQGWTAFFVELTFPNAAGDPFKFSTPIRIVPDRLPFKLPAAAASGASQDANSRRAE